MEQRAAATGVLAITGNVGRWVVQVSCPLCGGEDQRDTALHWDITVEQAQRLSDPARGEVIVTGHGCGIEKRPGVEFGIAPAVNNKCRQMFSGGAIFVHIAPPLHCMPLENARTTVRSYELCFPCRAGTGPRAVATARLMQGAPHEYVV